MAPLLAIAIFGTAALGGADLPIQAMLMSAVTAAMLGCALIGARARRHLAASNAVTLSALGGLILLVVLGASLTPYGPGGPNPTWNLVGGGGANALDRSRVLLELGKLAGLSCTFLLGIVWSASVRARQWAFTSLVCVGTVYFLWALVHQIAIGESRLSGGLPSANIAAALDVPLLFLGGSVAFLGVAQDGRQASRSQPFALALGLSLALFFSGVLALTASRGAFLALFPATMAYAAVGVLRSGGARWRSAAIVVFVIAAVAAIFVAKGDVILGRLGLSFSTGDINGRAVLFSEHWKAFLRSPLLGYGLGSFDAVNKLGFTSLTFSQLWPDRATHNVYLQWLEEAGVVGALPMFGVVGGVVVLGGLCVMQEGRHSMWTSALVAISVFFLVQGGSDFSLQVPAVGHFWALLLGLQFAGDVKGNGLRPGALARAPRATRKSKAAPMFETVGRAVVHR